jgi:tetratricopeptide (TPR) repeat protein
MRPTGRLVLVLLTTNVLAWAEPADRTVPRLNQAAIELQAHKDFAGAEREYLRAITLAGQQHATVELAVLHSNLGAMYMDMGLYAESEAQFLLSLSACQSAFGDKDIKTAMAFNAVGEARYKQAQPMESRQMFERALRILDADENANALRLALVLNNLALVDVDTGNIYQARKRLERVIQIYEAHAPNAAGLGIVLTNLAQVLFKTDANQAIALAVRGVSVLDGQGPTVAAVGCLVTLGALRTLAKDFDGAEDALDRALRYAQLLHREEDAAGAEVFHRLAALYAVTGRPKDAHELFARAVRIYRRDSETADPRRLAALSDYAAFLRTSHRKREAKEVEREMRGLQASDRAVPETGQLIDVASLLHQQTH